MERPERIPGGTQRLTPDEAPARAGTAVCRQDVGVHTGESGRDDADKALCGRHCVESDQGAGAVCAMPNIHGSTAQIAQTRANM